MKTYEKQIEDLIESLFELHREISIKEDILKNCSYLTRKSHLDDLNRSVAMSNQKMELLKILNK